MMASTGRWVLEQEGQRFRVNPGAQMSQSWPIEAMMRWNSSPSSRRSAYS